MRGLSDPEPDSQLGAGGRAAEIWIDEAEVLEGAPLRNLFGTASDREAERAFLTVQEQAEQRFDVLVEQMAAAEGVTEQLKAADQMLWARKMNGIRARAEEVVREEIIYTL